jgi:hypothetical protein
MRTNREKQIPWQLSNPLLSHETVAHDRHNGNMPFSDWLP